MHVYQAIRTAAKRSGVPLIEIGPAMGHNKAYVSSMISTGRRPVYSTLARILSACGYSLCAIPVGDEPASAVVIDPD